MNFLGLHTYPYASKNGGHATGSDEPTVFEFVGTVDDLQPDGDGDGAEVVGAGPDLVGLLGRLGRRALRRAVRALRSRPSSRVSIEFPT